LIIDAVATAAALPGCAICTLVKIIDAVARITSNLGTALRTQVHIVDAIATTAALLRCAIGTLVMIIDAVARTTSNLGAALRTQVHIVDAIATAAALLGCAIGTLVMIIDAVATGKRVTAEHQQHRKNQFHFTLPWACQETAWRWFIQFQ
jgi:DNA-binding GntR family transcriptional regulator